MTEAQTSSTATPTPTHPMPFGAQLEAGNAVRFRLFAPATTSVTLQLEGANEALLLEPEEDNQGWYSLTTPAASAGSRYRYLLADGSVVPDPASRYQPQDIAGPSEVIDPAAYTWKTTDWHGRPWSQAVLYELHVGTFTPEGTFASARQHLQYLADLGITGIELMCLADFAGNRNWGYDGVLLFAPDSAYGRPEDMKAFIDDAHALGIMVILDVVYNHFGPEGNYLPHYMPQVCSDRHTTPWGPALNFDGPGCAEVRSFILQNALYWIEEFQVDGLRLDASHAIIDDGPHHILDELREAVQRAADGRYLHLILEHEQNISVRLQRTGDGRPSGYTAQWNHDITHLLAAVLGRPCEDRQQDDNGETDKLGRALARGFVIAADEKGQDISCDVPPTAYVAFIQTHDLIGNRIFGDRLNANTSQAALRAIAAIYLLLPQIPLLFMGEEWAASTPFPFFCDYHGKLADDVREGRCEQLSRQDPAPSKEELARAPDPQADSTLRSAQLRWPELETAPHREWAHWYRSILRTRRQALVPLLSPLPGACGEYRVVKPGVLAASWRLAGHTCLHLVLNLCQSPAPEASLPPGQEIWLEGSRDGDGLGPWSVRWSLEQPS